MSLCKAMILRMGSLCLTYMMPPDCNAFVRLRHTGPPPPSALNIREKTVAHPNWPALLPYLGYRVTMDCQVCNSMPGAASFAARMNALRAARGVRSPLSANVQEA